MSTTRRQEISPQNTQLTSDSTPNSRSEAPHETQVIRRSRRWFERSFWLWASLLLVAAILSRFWGLTDKPFHHDESLHAYYSHAIAMGGHRDYDPLLHGPLLYYIVGFWQFLARVVNADLSDFVARTPAAFFGVLVVAIPLLIRRLVGSMGTLILMLFLLISPTNAYFGRFLREDVFTSIWVLGTLFGAALSRVLPDDRATEISFSKKFTIEFPFSPKTLATLFSTSMLALHFTNKENSFLHVAIWTAALAAIIFSERLLGVRELTQTGPSRPGEKNTRLLWCIGVFVIIFVCLFSSFFRHTQGWWNGVLDGLYRKSLLYWWEQDQQRRIDGPFDYHLPIIANYEFLLLPFLAVAWYRLLAISRAMNPISGKRFMPTRGGIFWITVSAAMLLLAATSFLPRIPLVAEACNFSDFSCQNTTPLGCHGDKKSIFCLLHISHSRHLLQILLYLFTGATAFLSAIHIRRRFDAFLWFWLTGAVGAYSYVGEKVPWLTLYIILPLILISGLEAARILGPSTLPMNKPSQFPQLNARPQQLQKSIENLERNFAHKLLPLAILWLACAIPFTAFKAWRVCGENAADPRERLIFTQTTPALQSIVNRWHQVASEPGSETLRIGIEGEATWPLAWYVLPFREHQFVNTGKSFSTLAETHRKQPFSALFLNDANVNAVAQALPDCNIYRIPLRAWWVPRPNPTLQEKLGYFFRLHLYPEANPESPAYETSVGLGSTKVLYLECTNPTSPFAKKALFSGPSLIIRSSN